MSLIFKGLKVLELLELQKSSKNNTPHDAVYGGGCIAILYLT